MAVIYTKTKVQEYEVQLFKTIPTTDDSVLWDIMSKWVDENTDYHLPPESEIAMASYQAYLNCLEVKGRVLSATSIGAISVAYAGNTGNEYLACVGKIGTILDSLNMNIDFKDDVITFFAIPTDKCND